MSVVCPTRIENFRALRASSGISEDAERWEAQEYNIREDMSRATSLEGQEIEQDLFLLFQEHSTDNWDGYGAKAVTQEGLSAAFSFWWMLPTTVPRPELGVDPDGSIVFEWYRRPRRVFSVTVEKDNRLIYAGLFDSNKASGTEYFEHGLPETIFLQIQRVIS